MTITYSVNAIKALKKHKYLTVPCTTFYTAAGPATRTVWWDRSIPQDRKAMTVKSVKDGIVYFEEDHLDWLHLSTFRDNVEDGSFVLVGVYPEPMAYLPHVPEGRYGI